MQATIDTASALNRFVGSADQQAFREILTTYQPMVFAVCRRVLGTSADAEDATHETFIKLSRHASSIRGSLGSWLYTCALNVSRDARHAAISRRQREREFSGQANEPQEPAFDADEYALLNRCMAQLEDQDREVIALYYFLDLTQEQIAVRHGITQVAVKRRLDRAIRALRYTLVRNGFDLSTASNGRACGITCEGEVDLVALGAVLIAMLLDGPGLLSQAGQVSQCSSVMTWGDGLGRRGAAITHGLMQTSDEGLTGRRRTVYRMTALSWPARGWHGVLSAVELAHDAADVVVRLLRDASSSLRGVFAHARR